MTHIHTIEPHYRLHCLHVHHGALVTSEYLGSWRQLIGQESAIVVDHLWIATHVEDDRVEWNVIWWPITYSHNCRSGVIVTQDLLMQLQLIYFLLISRLDHLNYSVQQILWLYCSFSDKDSLRNLIVSWHIQTYTQMTNFYRYAIFITGLPSHPHWAGDTCIFTQSQSLLARWWKSSVKFIFIISITEILLTRQIKVKYTKSISNPRAQTLLKELMMLPQTHCQLWRRHVALGIYSTSPAFTMFKHGSP